MKKLLFVIMSFLFIISCENYTNIHIDNDTDKNDEIIEDDQIKDAIDAVNKSATEKGLHVAELTKDSFIKWFEEWSLHALIKSKRIPLREAVKKHKLLAGYGFSAEDNSEYGLPDTISFVIPEYGTMPIVEGEKIWGYLEWLKNMFKTNGGDDSLIDEPFVGDPPPLEGIILDESVKIRVSKIEIPGECLVPGYEERDALKVEINLSKDNLDEVATYFGVGFGTNEIKGIANQLLDGSENKWIELQKLFPNWIKTKANTFPKDGDNEVCHGPAREFYFKELDARNHASTEAVEIMLDKHYCLVESNKNFVFGDYLYIPGMHSGRYVLKDPESNRDISFSVQSGGTAPYRFFWIDEDFSGEPFSGNPVPDLFETTVDVWRRCK